MSAIDAIGIEARQVLLEVMLQVAWADRQLAPEEQQAAHAAAMALGLVLPGERDLVSTDRAPVAVEALDVSPLKTRDRELVFVCAAWMAMADEEQQREETAVLERVQAHLGLSDDDAARLSAHAAALRAAQTADRTSWWRAFDRLVVQAARMIGHG